MTAAEQIARFAGRVKAASISSDAIEACGRSLVDTFAGAVGGSRQEVSQRALRYARRNCTPGIVGAASHWGTAEPLPLELAALCNGVASHALDFDDIAAPMRGHPSAAMLPALVALGESIDASGAELVCAYVVGFEVICKLSRAFAHEHYSRGWHSSSTIGIIGATVGCAKLLGLEDEQMANAIGLAAAQAAGLQANFGSDAKSFQIGNCNASALRAALLASEWTTASGLALEGDRGYLALYADGASIEDQFAALGTTPLEIVASGVDVKRYPVCYAAHRAIEAVLHLRRQHGIALGDVRSVHVRAAAGNLAPLIHKRPLSGVEATFSIQYAVAAALLDGSLSLSSFDDAAVRRPIIQDFLSRVSSDDSGPPAPGIRWSEVSIELSSGKRVSQKVEVLRGSALSPLSISELQDKVADCLRWGGSSVDSEVLVHDSLNLVQMSVRQWLSRALQSTK